MTKQGLIDKLTKEAREARRKEKEDNCEYQEGKAVAYENAIKYVTKLNEPKVEECEFLRIERNEFVIDWQCSNCEKLYSEITYHISNYCPNCGRKLKG